MDVSQEPIPVRMVNEVAYCPRLYALEHVFGEWADSADTVEGRTVHRRVDTPTERGLPEADAAEDPDKPAVTRSVHLGDDALGLVAKIDLVESAGVHAVPVDFKKGKVPDVPEQAYEPERVQVCAQAMLLRAHGYEVDHGILYFAGSRRRVRVEITSALVERTLELVTLARQIHEEHTLPPPLIDSPKCRGCSLVGICLPDEQNLLLGHRVGEVRPLVPARDDGIPLHVQLRGGQVGLSGGEIVVRTKEGEVDRARVRETTEVSLYGNISVTTPLLHELAKHDIPVALHSYGGWYVGSFVPASGRNVLLRLAQHAALQDPQVTRAIAQAFVHAKIRNQRTMLRRNAKGVPARTLDLLKESAEQALNAPNMDVLRGIEGQAARLYFEAFSGMLTSTQEGTFDFTGRNRRPPRDPINALLSFAYACLARTLTHTTARIGLDPYVGYLHTPRAGRPSLALDLMEEFRPLLADSAVINALNNGVLQRSDFIEHATGVALKDDGRKRFLQVIERRLDELVTHPTFGTRLSYRRVMEVQARLLGKVLLGELPTYPGFVTR